jgi:hypothetical protein
VVGASLSTNYGDFVEEYKPSASALYSNTWETDGGGRFGFLIDVAHSELATRTDGLFVRPFFKNANNDLNGDGVNEELWLPRGADWRTLEYERERDGAERAGGPHGVAEHRLGGVDLELLRDLVELLLVAHAGELEAGHDIVADRHRRERVRPLEHHADGAAHLHRVDLRRVDVLAVEQHGAVHPRPGDDLVHPVQRAQHRRLAAAGGPDERGDHLRRHRQRHALDRVELAVVDVQILDIDPLGHQVRRLTLS